MTIDRLHLAELIEKGSDADLLREMMTFVVNRMMDLDVESFPGAAYGERSADRTNQRNGYRERPWHTTLGTVHLRVAVVEHEHLGQLRTARGKMLLDK